MTPSRLKTLAAYSAPFWLPFVLLLQVRLMAYLAGAEWSDPASVASICMIFGMPIGAVIAAYAFVEG